MEEVQIMVTITREELKELVMLAEYTDLGSGILDHIINEAEQKFGK